MIDPDSLRQGSGGNTQGKVSLEYSGRTVRFNVVIPKPPLTRGLVDTGNVVSII